MLAARHAPFSLSPALADALTAAYATPPRAYHHLGHVAEVLAEFDTAADEAPWQRPAEVVAAILFHDAIYVAGRTDNEARSADLARARLADAGLPVDLDRVAHLITLTARHGALTPADVADDPDAARFLDADLAILGAPPDAYDRYEQAIAAEYAAIPPAAYRDGRRRFLARLLAAPRRFLSDAAHARLDGPARANLTRAVAALGG
jgi:predicted metal-dependent HD superfamily phosphohydrolase